ncbi:hypothetical protein B0A49_04306, partial [Cryomyces minteri]
MGEQERKPTPENATMLQGYEWNVPADGKHWTRLRDAVPTLKAIGVDNIWLPPGCKASSSKGNGFDIYDLYDLGEFDQKDGKATKWGTKEQLMDLMGAAKEKGVGVYWDAVLNHKAGADDKERCQVVEVDENGIEARISFPAVESSYRTKTISDPYEIEAWVKFDFLGRGDKHSKQKYRWYHFTGTDFDAATNRKAIFQVVGDNKGWSNSVDKEQGNADYM